MDMMRVKTTTSGQRNENKREKPNRQLITAYIPLASQENRERERERGRERGNEREGEREREREIERLQINEGDFYFFLTNKQTTKHSNNYGRTQIYK